MPRYMGDTGAVLESPRSTPASRDGDHDDGTESDHAGGDLQRGRSGGRGAKQGHLQLVFGDAFNDYQIPYHLRLASSLEGP
jgi:hypothetical protein